MPKRFILLSGKRCSGKDASAIILKESLEKQGRTVKIARFSDVAKEEFAKESGSDLQRIINDREYKESLRSKLCEFTNRQFKNHGQDYFIKKLIERCDDDYVYIVSDNRLVRESDYFKKNHPDESLCIRIHSSNDARGSRGWVYDPKIDTEFFETELDDYDFDIVIGNDSGLNELKDSLENHLVFYQEWLTEK